MMDAQETEGMLFKDLEWRNTGPANMSGRVTDIQAMDYDFRHVLVASASGGVWKSTNAGTTWESIFDQYGSASIGAVAIFPKNPDIIWVGTGEANVRNSVGWGDGMYKSTDGGETWLKLGNGLPDDGKTGCTDIKMDPTDWTTVYTESQGGRIRRNHALFRQKSMGITPNETNTLNWEDVVPRQTDSSRPAVRMNWNTPFGFSHHNPHTLYYGANFLLKSVDRGDHWQIISPDLSTNDPKKTLRDSGGLTRDVTGAEVHCTLITISESPLVPGLIWVGTDDGNVQLTLDDGVTWTNVRPNIPDVQENPLGQPGGSLPLRQSSLLRDI